MTQRSSATVKSCCAGFYELPVVSMLLGDTLHPGGAGLTRKLGQAALVGRETRVLDVACGRGESARVLAAHFGCNVVGLDYSAENVRNADRLTRKAELAGRATFLRGDAERLPFDDQSFDVVLSECSLCTFPNIGTALAEIQRVLRPGGRVGISDVVLTGPIPDSLQNLIGHVLCISGARAAAGYRDALGAAGFTAIRTRDVSQVLSEMLDRIERRIDALDRLAAPMQLDFPQDLAGAEPQLVDARDFIASGGAGYVLMTGRKPRNSGGQAESYAPSIG